MDAIGLNKLQSKLTFQPLTIISKVNKDIQFSGEHYSRLTDLLSFAAVKKMHSKMSKHPVGSRILREKPRITD